MLTKELVKEQIENLPNEFSIEDLIEKIILIDKIETGLKQSDNNETITEEELDLSLIHI